VLKVQREKIKNKLKEQPNEGWRIFVDSSEISSQTKVNPS